MFLILCLFLMIGCKADQPRQSLKNYLRDLKSRLQQSPESAELRSTLQRLRNAEAMSALVERLSPAERPSRITYIASGDHLAPLILCEALPEGKDCEILMTEIDAGVQEGISAGLEDLEREGCIAGLERVQEISGSFGEADWAFRLAAHRIRLRLLVADPSRHSGLIRPDLLEGRDLVISHDWAGDPLGNLQVIRQFLERARKIAGPPPMLMIENLEAHPYPVDLEFFGPRARSDLPYGHRDADEGAGRHGRIELGQPVFGGGILLGFDDPWWKNISDSDLDLFFDFLLFNEFDFGRQNVISGGPKPVVAPLILDWWTAFGSRDIRGARIEDRGGMRKRMLNVLPEIAGLMPEKLRQRLACRAALYLSLLELESAGVETLKMMPSAGLEKLSGPFPDGGMQRLYRQSLRRIGEFRQSRQTINREAGLLLAALRYDDGFSDFITECPAAGTAGESPAERRETYLSIRGWLEASRVVRQQDRGSDKTEASEK